MKKQVGFTLIEIMIALTLGLIVIAAVVTIYIATIRSSNDTILSTRLNHDLESVMILMTNDIKRSGYWAGAADGVSNNNPFTNKDATAGAITNVNILNNGACLLYGYDADNDRTVDLTNNRELYGFKFENATIKMRKTGTSTSDCSNGTWEDFIDSNQLTITALTFSFAPSGINTATSRCWNQTQKYSIDNLSCEDQPNAIIGAANDYIIQNRMVNISMSGRVTSDNSVTKTLSGSVEIRNNRICVWDGVNCP